MKLLVQIGTPFLAIFCIAWFFFGPLAAGIITIILALALIVVIAVSIPMGYPPRGLVPLLLAVLAILVVVYMRQPPSTIPYCPPDPRDCQ